MLEELTLPALAGFSKSVGSQADGVAACALMDFRERRA
jgi:hypothetical protein